MLPHLPRKPRYRDLAKAAHECHACPLWKNATQTVFGDGPVSAKLMLVGEQPGDQEDKQGRTFVGPAGHELDRALAQAKVPRELLYLTNAVKHFKWTPRGKRRLHAKPNMSEVHACRPWFDAELALVAPEVIVLMGATAVASVFGGGFRLTEHLGETLEVEGIPARIIVTYHPSAVLRMRSDPAAYELARKRLVADLRRAATLAHLPRRKAA